MKKINFWLNFNYSNIISNIQDLKPSRTIHLFKKLSKKMLANSRIWNI